jgi:hypothetical protein
MSGTKALALVKNELDTLNWRIRRLDGLLYIFQKYVMSNDLENYPWQDNVRMRKARAVVETLVEFSPVLDAIIETVGSIDHVSGGITECVKRLEGKINE